MAGDEPWREGYRLLEARLAALPTALRAVLAAPPLHLAFDPARIRRFVISGVGSSAAHARLLATLLQEVGIVARFVPLTALLSRPEHDARGDALVVFSQGFSPNARLATRFVEAWSSVAVLTSVPEPGGATLLFDEPAGATGGAESASAGAEPPPSGALEERQRELAALAARGVDLHRFPGAEEYGTLLRLIGPMTGYAAAIRFAGAVAGALQLVPAGLLPATIPVDAVCEKVAGARARLEREQPELGAGTLEAGFAFLASGTYVELLSNLRAKVVEGMLLPPPTVSDLLEFVHGPFQQSFARPATFFALTRAEAGTEPELLARLASVLAPERHRLLHWHTDLPGALALFEHEALLDALVLRYIAERKIDQVRWPGRGADAALYGFGAQHEISPPSYGTEAGTSSVPRPSGGSAAKPGYALETLAWPDVERLLTEGYRSAVLPLGSTEQHGPHLPFATDTLIANAIATRLCARLGGVLRLPTVGLGCASEHLAFPGTLSLAAETLAAVLRDVGCSLAKHGFERLLVFTAHGGNYAVLRAAAKGLSAELAPLRLHAFTDFARLTSVLREKGEHLGVSADDAGQHAGELETSILYLLAPALVRRDRLRQGLVDSKLPADELFYPDLRRHAPDGTVGDPRSASVRRADAYLDAWVDVLVEAWSSDAKKRKKTKGT